MTRYLNKKVYPVGQPGNGEAERKDDGQRQEVADPVLARQRLMKQETCQDEVGKHKCPAGPRFPACIHEYAVSLVFIRFSQGGTMLFLAQAERPIFAARHIPGPP